MLWCAYTTFSGVNYSRLYVGGELGLAFLPREWYNYLSDITAGLYYWSENMKTTIYLVRHGESLGNQSRTMLGHTNLDLSPLGYLQAERTAKELSGIAFDAIYSSDLIRAYNTAKPHAALRGMEIIPSASLRELYVGEWENMHVDDIIAGYGELFTVGWRKNFGTFTTPGGEDVDAARERFYGEIVSIAGRHEGGCVLVTAHAGVIRLFWGKICGIPSGALAEAYQYPSNASYSVVEWDGETLSPVSYSNDSHPAELNTTLGPW